MSRVTVTLAPVPGGWSIITSLSACPLMFLSAAKAEAQAHGLARLAVRLGRDAEIRLHDLAGDLILARTYPAKGIATTARFPRKRRAAHTFLPTGLTA